MQEIHCGNIVENVRTKFLYRVSWVDSAAGRARGQRVTVDATGKWHWLHEVKAGNIKLAQCRVVEGVN